MSKENKIFQPKVIIGSITSFVVAAVGIVAVFFPSLLNLEKKSIAEKAIFLRSQDSLKELEEFLLKNVNRPVHLTIGYCNVPSRTTVEDSKGNSKSLKWLEDAYNNTNWSGVNRFSSYYVDHFGDNPRKNEEEELDVVAAAKITNIIEGADHEFIGLNLENGGIAWSEERGLYKEIRIPYDSQKGKKYIWTTGDEFGAELDKCPKEITKFEGYEFNHTRQATITGTFFVHEQDMDPTVAYKLYQPYSEYQAFYSMELEPLDKKDLEMRNY
ncbi:hypothetical protein T36_1017 [Helicobacter cinaedi]|uniref:hypothetical protein n=1 Tax=Helicobacter cinaedi TaxID=213 RepID=UPI001F1EF6C5|nr:hypothetical protein [Helicobacter cinaedi]BDB64561.1 hypothetical protein T36_1017 [Helicobacter cinaedi]